MAAHPSSSDVVVGLLTENTTRLIAQAVRLLRSIRWFGGTLAKSRKVVCSVGELPAVVKEQLRDLGAEIRVVSRFHPANPTANRHQLIAELLDAPERLLFLLDCDTLVVQDPLPHLDLENFQAKIAPGATVTDEVFDRLFARFGVPKPPRDHAAWLCGTKTIPYFNGGVLAIPRDLARRLAPCWRKYNLLFAEQPELVAPCEKHMHQAALSLALAEAEIPSRALDLALNFQTNAPHLPNPPVFAETDPVIIHYHHLASDDGYLLPCAYPKAQARIDAFHERLRASGIERATPLERPATEGRAVLVLGMHRSGTSLAAQLVSAMGVYAGEPDELPAADMFNPSGYWELNGVAALDDEILALFQSDAMGCARADVGRMAPDARADFAGRAERLIASLRARSAFVLKDPRISLLVPFWREVLGNPLGVIAWRHPMAVARSLLRRDGSPLLWSIATWEHYNRVLLRDSVGLPRLLLSYERLVASPEAVAGELFDWLKSNGVEGLVPPDRETLRQIVLPDFNRSGRDVAGDESLLDDDQKDLLAALADGSALTRPIAPTSPSKLALIDEIARLERRERESRQAIASLRWRVDDLEGLLDTQVRATVAASDAEWSQRHTAELELLGRRIDALCGGVAALESGLRARDELLGAIFASRTWKLGDALTGAIRRLRRDGAVGARERWDSLRRGRES